MSNPYLLPEIFDYTIDLLRDQPETLKECCLVSKSWIPRTRKHLFAEIRFRSADNLVSWKKTFPDPANSPAYHAHSLFVGCIQIVEEADAEEGGWIQAFSSVERLTVNRPWLDFDAVEVSLAPFRRLSRSVKYLRVTSVFLPRSVFNLIHSLPLLEDLTLIGHDTSVFNNNELDTSPSATPLASPAFTGTLQLLLFQGMMNVARRLVDLPNGLHFRKLSLSWREEGDLRWVVMLVVACCRTLEYLDITCELDDELEPGPVDLSTATKLKNVVFRCGSLSSEWVVKALETITYQHRDLCEISIHLPDMLNCALNEDGVTIERIEEPNLGTQWLDLDRLLVQFWDSRSIRPKVVHPLTENEKKEMGDWAGHLFPELTKRGIIDLVEYSSGSRM